MALKESQRLERELTGYVDWICRAEDLVLAEERTTESDREMILEGDQQVESRNQYYVHFTWIFYLSSQETNETIEENEFYEARVHGE